MIKEQLVSFEVAQLLKAKGFNVIVTDSYRANGQLRGEFKFCNYPAPTQQMAMRWLREKHDIKISLYYRMVLGKWQVTLNYPTKCGSGGRILGKYTIYEDAVEIAIKYCLEEIVK